MRRLQNTTGLVLPRDPRYGCAWAIRGDSPHVLHWHGWWESGNPAVALPRWRCSTCGGVTTDTPAARRASDGAVFRAAR